MRYFLLFAALSGPAFASPECDASRAIIAEIVETLKPVLEDASQVRQAMVAAELSRNLGNTSVINAETAQWVDDYAKRNFDTVNDLMLALTPHAEIIGQSCN